MTFGDMLVTYGHCEECKTTFTRPLEIGEDLQCPVCKSTNWKYHRYEKSNIKWPVFNTESELYSEPNKEATEKTMKELHEKWESSRHGKIIQAAFDEMWNMTELDGE